MEKRHWDKAEELLLQVLEGIERNRAVPYDILPNKQTLLTIYWHKGHINNSEKLAVQILKDSIRELAEPSVHLEVQILRGNAFETRK
jgi:hypothetical protein